VTSKNPYNNLTFSVNLNFYKNENNQDYDEKEKEEILWILVVSTGGMMIIGFLIPLVKQSKVKEEAMEENKQTILTVDDDFKNGCIDISRASAEALSVRESVKPNAISKEGTLGEEEYFTH